MVIFCNRDNTHGCVKIVYPSGKITWDVGFVFLDIGLGKAKGDGVDLNHYLNYAIRVAAANPRAMVLAVAPDAWGDPVRNIRLAWEFLHMLRKRGKQVPRNLVFLIVVHGGLVDAYWVQYKELYREYSEVVAVGFAVPCRKLDLGDKPVDCNRRPRVCAWSIYSFLSRVRQELGGVLVHLLGANKRELASLAAWGVFTWFSRFFFDSDAYREVPNDEVRRKCLGDGRFMIDESRCSPKMWAQAWLGELVKYVVVHNEGN